MIAMTGQLITRQKKPKTKTGPSGPPSHHGADRMKDPTPAEIKKAVEAKGGTFLCMTGTRTYLVNGIWFSQSALITAHKAGQLA